MSRHSQRPDTFALGPVYAHGFMRVPVNAFLRKPAKGLHGSRPLLSKPLGRQAAWAASRKRDSYLRAQFFRLKSRRGSKKAVVAVAASIITAVYYMLHNEIPYRELGADYFHQRDKEQLTIRMTRRLRELGFDVTLTPLANATP